MGKYDLTGLARGLGGSSPTAHNTGAPFARLDGAVGKFDLPPNLAGKVLFLKLQSFNTLGGGLQDLSTCTVYTYATRSSGISEPDIRAARDRLRARSRPGDRYAHAGLMTSGSVVGAASASLDLGAIAVLVVHPITLLCCCFGSPVDPRTSQRRPSHFPTILDQPMTPLWTSSI